MHAFQSTIQHTFENDLNRLKLSVMETARNVKVEVGGCGRLEIVNVVLLLIRTLE